MLEGYYWAVFDTYPRCNPELFLRYTAALCGPRDREQGYGDWKLVRECKTQAAAQRLANKLNKREEQAKEPESQSSKHCDAGWMNDVRFGDPPDY